MADWSKIKTEYITTDTSYRKLAEKYGINKDTIYAKAKKEGWPDKRRQFVDRTQTKMLAVEETRTVDRATKLLDVSDLLLMKVRQRLESDDKIALDTQGMRHISGVLKDLKEIQMVRSEMDLREQEARIAKLQREAREEDTNKEPIRVIIDAGLDGYTH